MKRETFEALRNGTDKRPWLVLGGPFDGKRVDLSGDVHLCERWAFPRINENNPFDVEKVIYNIHHDDHLLVYEFMP